MKKHLVPSIKRACKSFGNTIKHFDLRANNNNGFPERNLSYHFAKEFAGKSGLVFLEKPFAGHGDEKFDKHIDGVAFSKPTVVIWETKRLYSKEKLEDICKNDAKRLTRPRLKNQIMTKLNLGKVDVYALILAECWKILEAKSEPKIVDWWTNDYGKEGWEEWDRICRESDLDSFDEFGSKNIAQIKEEDGKQWDIDCLYAIKQLD